MKIWWFTNITSLQQVLIVNHYFAVGYMPRQNPVNITIKHSNARIVCNPEAPLANVASLADRCFDELSLPTLQRNQRLNQGAVIIPPSSFVLDQFRSSVSIMKAIDRTMLAMQPGSITTKGYEVTERSVIVSEFWRRLHL